MFAVPELTPVTKPVVLTEAVPELLLVHVPPLVTFSYSYNWPVALPKEESTLPQNSFTSLTLSRMINFKPR